MLCRNPFLKDGAAYGCGQCMPCRINKRREWAHRIMLEAALHSDNCFVTLTYEDGQLPISATGLPTLNPKHLQDWLKRFRVAISPLRVRFYACGEYGDMTQRPHYHIALFGMKSCLRGRTKKDVRTGRPLASVCCEVCRGIQDSWSVNNIRFGDIDVGVLNDESANYIAGYVTKKMTSKDDPRLNGRHREFARQSRHPGIGVGMMHEVASTMLEFNLEDMPDVPSALRHGTRLMPLGRHLRRKLRSFVGREEGAPQSTLDEQKARLQPLREAAFDASRPLAKEIVSAADNKVLKMEQRQKLFKKEKKI